MIAFFRDRDPAGRSEPEGMESTSPSTNDVDVLSSSTLAVASLATPAPSLQEETPHEEVEHQYLWRCFPDYVWSQRVRDTPSWVWGFGYDVEDSSGGRRWVCRRCIQNKNPKPRSFAEKGIQNANAHLFKGHGIRAPPDKTKSAAEKKAEKLKVKDQRSIAEVMKLDTRLPREQDIANSLVKGFDRKHFQRLLLEWIIEENHAFSVCEQGRLRQIFEYLNPLVKITDANITRTTIRRKVLSAYEMHKDKVVAALKQSCGLIHVSFDGWKSGNRHSLYGIACFFRDENSQPRKLALGVPELRTRHFGHNIAAEILDVLDAYGIQDKIGYFTLDNAESNDKAMEVIGGELGFVGSRRRGRCFGHTLNLSAKALLFGHNVEAFEEQLSGEAALSEAEHTLWRRKGPVGKLHNLVVDVRRSDQLTYLLRSIQRSEFDLSSDPRIRARQPVDLIIDNDTRWLSQLYMIRRAIILRPFIEQLVLKHRQQWEQDNRSKRTGNLRKSAREPRICLEENQLTVNDWVVLEHLAKLLGFYEDAVKTLEGDGQQRKRKGGWVGSYGNVWEVIQGFEFLLEVLEDYKQLASEIPDAEHFRINVNLGWEKLNKYYSRLDETPIYYTALALHPAFRWGYFENEWKDNTEWVMKAKQMVREVWESDYRHLQVVRSPVDDEPVAKRQRKYYNPFQAYCERTRPVLGYGLVKEEATLSDDINEDTNELELWQSSWEDGDNDVRDPISYWHERKLASLSRICGAWMEVLPSLLGNTANNNLLAPAIKALGVSIVARGHNGRAPIPDALQAQCVALHTLQGNICHTKDSSFNALAASMMCLFLSEILLPTSPTGSTIHAEGVATLLQRYPPSFYSSGTPHKLFAGFRPILVLHSFLTRRSSFLATDSWKTEPFADVSATPLQALMNDVIAVPAIFEELDTCKFMPASRAAYHAENALTMIVAVVDRLTQSYHSTLLSGNSWWYMSRAENEVSLWFPDITTTEGSVSQLEGKRGTGRWPSTREQGSEPLHPLHFGAK
ncbi:putative AC transposase [Fusarium oxysporum f. sp. raphani]|uniref:Putative AC transposase n=1 Tax=Fusarium oxysporum f. sp. raphani TaxID=96318 RepID=A0A8J5U5H6_FUSOX|nr:putative AC transposase [Fusarium oxysporum f. sp. raphani]